MDLIVTEVVDLVAESFCGASGPVAFKYSESGWWFEWEGKDVAKGLLDLNPKDIRHEDIVQSVDGSFVFGWMTVDSFLWLIPGVVRVCFEVEASAGELLLQGVFSELEKLLVEGGVVFSVLQIEALLMLHETFYCSENFNWNSGAHLHPLIVSFRDC